MENIKRLKDCVSNLKSIEGKSYFRKENICYLDTSGRVPLIRFRPFDKFEWLDMGFSTRIGGVSEGGQSSLNFDYARDNDAENVRENYRRAAEAMGGDYKKLVLSDQVHDIKVEYVDEKFAAGENVEKKLKGIDGMVTDKPGIILATSFADCVPLFFVDPVHKAIGNTHSGWRGTVGMIGRATIGKMDEYFCSSPDEMICVIGPSICQKCYEVSEDVIEEVKKVYPKNEWNEIFYSSKKDKDGQKYQLDLWAANYHQIKLAGIKEKNIYVSGLCTCCNSDVLFSHRASNGDRGTLNGFMGII